jgi:hypothetical protein
MNETTKKWPYTEATGSDTGRSISGPDTLSSTLFDFEKAKPGLARGGEVSR